MYTDASISLAFADFTTKMAIASSLLQAKNKCRQACPSTLLVCFSQGSIPESFVKKN
jgi:hypothetical protein